MKGNYLQTFIPFFLSSILNGQEPFVPSYKFSDDILSTLSKDSLNYKAAWELSYIGEYKKSLEIWDRDEKKGPTLTEIQLQDFLRYKPINASKYIISRAKTEQIIILNEAHQQPYHRVFTTSLLADLYEQGFRYFGAEAIWGWDTTLDERKYPTLNTGSYTQEPFYGNLVREALRIGFTVFSYESTRRETDSAGVNLREVEQAKNIKKILDKDPQAKILIHCGFDHITETPYFSWGKAMAGRLQEYTGINPFTIDQVRLTEHSDRQFENPYFRMINLNSYSFFIDSTNNIFNGPLGTKEYDARLYHPRTNWINGRPHWVFEEGRKAFFVKKITLSFPCIVFAYLADENTNVRDPLDMPIPYDIIELKAKNDKKALSLKSGKYRVIIKDKMSKCEIRNITIE